MRILTFFPKSTLKIPILTLLISFSILQASSLGDKIPNFDFNSDLLDPQRTGFTMTQSSPNYSFGWAVSSLGDIDNDGYSDIIISAREMATFKGAVFVIYGGPESSFSDINFATMTLDPKKTGFVIYGEEASSFFGTSVNPAGDIDNDGYDDILIGAYGYDNSRGAAYVIYGGPKSSMENIMLDSTSLDPLTTGFRILGAILGDSFGHSVCTAGDIDNDGFDDLIIGAFERTSSQGTVYAIYGGPRYLMTNIALASTTLSPATSGFIITGEASVNYLGYSVSQAGDVDNDGFDDIIVGAYGNNNRRGASYVIYGRPRSSMGNIALGSSLLDTLTTGFSVKGQANSDRFGSEVSIVGDVNGDGYGDIIVGSRWKNNYQGAAYLIYGGPKSSMANLDLSSQPLDPLTTGFTMTGAAINNYFGFAASIAGDVNNDGFGDIIIGAYGWNNNQGAVYVIYGGPKSSLPNIDFGLAVLDPKTTGFMIKGKGTGSRFGYTVNGAGNVNKDDYDDIVIGAYASGGSNKGAAYLIHYACPIEHCEQCLSRSSCKICEQGYGVEDSICKVCPADCFDCSTASDCEKCNTPFLLYRDQCLQTCLNGTFPSESNDECQDCPVHCSSCTSAKSCQTCNKGYILTNSLCAPPPPSLLAVLKTEAKVSRAISSSASGLGSLLSIGSSTFPINTLMSKTVQNTRYIDLSVTKKLAEAYESWKTQMIEWDFPDILSRLDHFNSLPFLFAKYDLDSPFLVNFWSTMMTMTISLSVLIIASALKILFNP